MCGFYQPLFPLSANSVLRIQHDCFGHYKCVCVCARTRTHAYVCLRVRVQARIFMSVVVKCVK